jgi:hypothetical protein
MVLAIRSAAMAIAGSALATGSLQHRQPILPAQE